MKIAHFLTSVDLKGGGVTRAVLDLCSGMAAYGHQVVLMVGEDIDVPAAWRVPPGADAWDFVRGQKLSPAAIRVEVKDLALEVKGRKGYRLGSDRPTHYLSGAGKDAARRVLEGAEVLHLHGPWATPNMQLGRMARAMKKPYVISPHGMLDDWCMNEHGGRKRLHLALFSRRLLEGAQSVHCTAQGEADQSAKLFPRGRAVVAPLLVDMSPFRTLPGPELARAKFEALRRPGFKVLCLSRLNKVKGLERVLIAAAALVRAGQDVQLVFAGPADPAEYADVLRGRAAELGIGERLHLLGMVSGLEKVSLYQAADVYVQPSVHENFGLSLVESLACGVPIVTAKGVNIWPELKQSGGAVIVGNEASADEAELRLELAGLLADPTRRAEMGKAGRRWALEILDQARIVRKYETIYGETRVTVAGSA